MNILHLVAVAALFQSLSSFAQTNDVLSLSCHHTILGKNILNTQIESLNPRFNFTTDHYYDEVQGRQMLAVNIDNQMRVFISFKNNPKKKIFVGTVNSNLSVLKDYYRRCSNQERLLEVEGMYLGIRMNPDFKVTRNQISPFYCERSSIASSVIFGTSYQVMSKQLEKLIVGSTVLKYTVKVKHESYDSRASCLDDIENRQSN